MQQLSLLEQSRLEHPSLDDDERVVRVAESILIDLDACAPISLEMVASYQDVSSIVRCPLPNAGCLITDPETGATEIRLRASDNSRRQRFSGFHEVSHTFMPGYQLRMQLRCDPRAGHTVHDQIEGLCDVGASQLLLPRHLVRRDLEEADFAIGTLVAVAEKYESSLQAAGHRMVDLCPEDAMLLVAEVQNKPSEGRDDAAEPKLRVSYAWSRGTWPFVLRFKSIDPSDPLHRAHEGELVDELTCLAGIVAHEVEDVRVCARAFPYTNTSGVRRDRVLALYRRL